VEDQWRQLPSTQLSPVMQSEACVQLLVASLVVAHTMSMQKFVATSWSGQSAFAVHGERHAPLWQTEPGAHVRPGTPQPGFTRVSRRQTPASHQSPAGQSPSTAQPEKQRPSTQV
jgi:hypothetical protein